MKPTVFALAAVAWMLGSVAMAQQGAAPTALTNPGFESPFQPVAPVSEADSKQAKITGVVAQGWGDNSNWADVTIDYAQETLNPHRGTSCQRITVSRVAGGTCQFVQNVTLQKGHVYEARVWLRGTTGAGIKLSLRQQGTPYTTYAQTRASVSPEWQEFRVAGLVGDDTTEMLMLSAEQPTTFWADDARLVDVTQAVSVASPSKGNLLGDGSFEAGLSFGWSVRFQGLMRHAFEDPRPQIDAATAAAGRQSLRADIPEGDSVEVCSPVFHFNFGRTHTASIWLKASEPGTPVQMGIEGTDIQQSVSVGKDWQRFAVSGRMPFKEYARLRLQCAAPEGGAGRTLWLDGAQVEEQGSASPGYIPAKPLDLTLRLTRPGNVVFDGEKALVQIGVGPQAPRGAKLHLSMESLNGKRRVLADVPLPHASLALPAWPGRPRGVFKLTGTVVDPRGRALSATVPLVWARLPRPREISPQKSYFGIHIPLSPNYIALARAVGARWVRLHDTSMIGKWAAEETSPGHFEFHDDGVTAAHRGGLAILGMLDGAPAWTTTRPREGGYWGLWNIPDKPDAAAQWQNYVRTVATHYKGRIDTWEVWNEPWGAWWLESGNPNATPALYARLMQIADTTAHAANPDATVVGVDTYQASDSTWTDPVLKAAGTGAYDIFSFHDYSDSLYGGPENHALVQARTFRALQGNYGTVKPLWNTEGGLFAAGSFYAPETGGLPARDQPAYIVRYDVCMMGAGVQKFFPYAVHTDPSMGNIETNLTEFDRAIKPFLAARAVLASLVDGAGRPTRSEPVKGVDDYTFPAQNGQTVSVLWSYDGASHPLPIQKGVKVLDIWGNRLSAKAIVTVGPEPLYLLR